MLDKLTKLIEVKKIMALIMTVLFFILAIRGDITTEQTMSVIIMIMTYYFTVSTGKELRK